MLLYEKFILLFKLLVCSKKNFIYTKTQAVVLEECLIKLLATSAHIGSRLVAYVFFINVFINGFYKSE